MNPMLGIADTFAKKNTGCKPFEFYAEMKKRTSSMMAIASAHPSLGAAKKEEQKPEQPTPREPPKEEHKGEGTPSGEGTTQEPPKEHNAPAKTTVSTADFAGEGTPASETTQEAEKPTQEAEKPTQENAEKPTQENAPVNSSDAPAPVKTPSKKKGGKNTASK